MSNGRLTTHVLDTASGCPANGLMIELFLTPDSGSRTLINSTRTNEDGRTDAPVLEGANFMAGTYELLFHAGAYLVARGLCQPHALFLDCIPVRFNLTGEGHYHVPLLLSPFGYSTYRGS